MKRKLCLLPAIIVCLLLSTPAVSAALVASFNQGTSFNYTADGPAGTPASWTTNVAVGPSTDAGSGLSLQLISGFNLGTTIFTVGSGSPYFGLTDTFAASNFGAGAVFEIGNLDAAKTYDIYVISANAEGASTGNIYGGTYTVTTGTGGSGSTTGIGTTESAWVLGTNYTVLSNTQSDGLGNLQITISPQGSQTNFAFAGVQIVEVPEPGSLALLGLGGLLIARRRRG